jgi:hypothetical protein
VAQGAKQTLGVELLVDHFAGRSEPTGRGGR